MSRAEGGGRRADDRIRVPGNGHRPPLGADEPASPPIAEGPRVPRPSPDVARIAFTPGQLAAGFGIIASLILLVLGRRRIRRRDG